MKKCTIIALVSLSLIAIGTGAAEARYRATSLSVCAWSNLDWSQLSTRQRNLWAQLGWNEPRWDEDHAPTSDNKDWSELSPNERHAASQLGFNASSWELSCAPEGGTVRSVKKNA